MVKLLDLSFGQFMGHFGFVVGALMLLAAAVGLIAALRRSWTPPMVYGVLAIALFGGGLLFGPAAPRVARAFWRLATLPPAPAPSGRFPVQTAIVALPPVGAEGEAIIVQIWHPAPAEAAGHDESAAAPTACAAFNGRLAEPSGMARFPLLLYAPGINGPRDDNASTSASLASQGYVVVAIDDIDHDRPANATPPPLSLDLASEAGYKESLRRGADKAVLEARRALQALDRLAACAALNWRDHVRFDRIGFFGFSYGGSVAAAAGGLDPRVAAIANLDGYIFGDALAALSDKPYMLLYEDEFVPGAHTLGSPDPNVHYYALMIQDFLVEHKQLLELPDKYGFRLRHVRHEAFSDWAFSRPAFKSWLFVDPARVWAIKDFYLAAFFAAYLGDGPKTLLTETPSPFPGVDVLKGRPHWSDGEEQVPVLAWMGLD